MTLTVYHLGVSQSERIVWLCEELEIPYELVRFDRRADNKMAPPAYKEISPTGTAPVIKDGDVVLAESGACIEYIIHRHGNGRLAVKPDSPEYPNYLFWFHYSNSSIMAMEMVEMFLSRVEGASQGFAGNVVSTRQELGYKLLEERLGVSPYLGGPELTAADIMIFFILTTMRAFVPKDLKAFPNIAAYLQRVGARPAYQRAMKKGDPDMKPNLS